MKIVFKLALVLGSLASQAEAHRLDATFRPPSHEVAVPKKIEVIETDEDVSASMESIKESEQQLKMYMQTPSMKKQDDSGPDYSSEALLRQTTQEDREKDETLNSLHEAESDVQRALKDAPAAPEKKPKKK